MLKEATWRELEVGDLLLAVVHRFDELEGVRLEDADLALLVSHSDELAVGRVLARPAQLVQQLSVHHLPALEVPDAQRLVVADRAALLLGGMRRQAPQLAFPVALATSSDRMSPLPRKE